MSDLRELYQDVILDHGKRPRNFGKPAGANRCAQGVNPLCGDKVTVHLRIEDGVVQEVGFEGTGCAISTASASMMTQILKGRPVAEALELSERFHNLVTLGSGPAGDGDGSDLGKLKVFSGVREFPTRVKCATLVWHALRAAVEDRERVVSTE